MCVTPCLDLPWNLGLQLLSNKKDHVVKEHSPNSSAYITVKVKSRSAGILMCMALRTCLTKARYSPWIVHQSLRETKALFLAFRSTAWALCCCADKYRKNVIWEGEWELSEERGPLYGEEKKKEKGRRPRCWKARCLLSCQGFNKSNHEVIEEGVSFLS